MPSLKDLKIRIESVKSTRKITKAMQMVAAAKLRRAQEAAENARPYAERMREVVANLAASAKDTDSAPRLLAGTGADETSLLLVATAERGLCGGFNSSISRLARARVAALQKAGKSVKILTIGKKGREQLKREFEPLMIGHVDLSAHRRIGYEVAREITSGVLERFEDGEFDTASVFYSRFQSVISQIPTERHLVPVRVEDGVGANGRFYDYEPDESELLTELLRRRSPTRFSQRFLKTPRPNRVRACPLWTMRPETRAI